MTKGTSSTAGLGPTQSGGAVSCGVEMPLPERIEVMKSLVGEMMPFKQRKVGLKQRRDARPEDSFSDFYSYLINEWIPTQPDSSVLMKLFVVCNFSAEVFVAVMYGLAKPEDFLQNTEKEAEE